ncbi:MAG: hypothetical protein AB7E48_06715 [Deferribacterales bacterium]
MKMPAIKNYEKLTAADNFIRKFAKWVNAFENKSYDYEERVKGFIKWFRKNWPKHERTFDLLFLGYVTLHQNACDPDAYTLEFRPDIKTFLDAGGIDNLKRLEEHFKAVTKHTLCSKCSGSGVFLYANTATWRSRPGTIAGSAMTSDVCDECWGTGDTERKGRNLKEDEINALKIKLGLLRELQQEASIDNVKIEQRIKRLERQIADYKGEK